MKEVGVGDAVVGKRGSIWTDVRGFLCGSCEKVPVVWVISVGYVTAHWEDLGRIPPQGGPYNDEASTADGTGCYVGLLRTVGGDVIGGHTWGGDLRLLPPKHSLTVHQDQGHYEPVSFGRETPNGKGVQSHYGPVSFGRETPSDKGVQAVVGAGGHVIRKGAYGGSGTGTVGEGGVGGGGGWRWRWRWRHITRFYDTVATIIS